MAKTGDIVRYLNAVGGGRVVRTDGNMAWVDDDGFETPVLLRECVVVRTAEQIASAEGTDSKKQTTAVKAPAPETSNGYVTESEPASDFSEIAGNDRLNIVLGFEPTDRSRLTESDFDATLINDTNYYIYFNLASRGDDSVQWTSLYAGLVEPNTELWLGTYGRSEIAQFDRLNFDCIAFKKDKDYQAKAPVSISVKVDTTKFFKLHCYRSNPYFDSEVLAFNLIENDIPADRRAINLDILKTEPLRHEAVRKNVETKHSAPKSRSTSSNGPLVVDLHIDELLDSTAGMSAADILNYQIDTFRRIMDENLRNFGRRIVFIHGKGDGILRQALVKELTHRYKGHEYSDASFSEYGYGATQVTIRQNIKKGQRR